jgi:hypothetical protein
MPQRQNSFDVFLTSHFSLLLHEFVKFESLKIEGKIKNERKRSFIFLEGKECKIFFVGGKIGFFFSFPCVL